MAQVQTHARLCIRQGDTCWGRGARLTPAGPHGNTASQLKGSPAVPWGQDPWAASQGQGGEGGGRRGQEARAATCPVPPAVQRALSWDPQLHSLGFWLHCRNSDKSLTVSVPQFSDLCNGMPSHNAMSANPPGLYFLSSLSMPQAPGDHIPALTRQSLGLRNSAWAS